MIALKEDLYLVENVNVSGIYSLTTTNVASVKFIAHLNQLVRGGVVFIFDVIGRSSE